MKTINIKKDTLVDLIKGTKGATFITFKAKTAVKVNKSNPYFGRITKISEVNAQLNFNYQNAVNNRLTVEGKEADFLSKGLKWGQKDHNNSVVENKGIKYLQVRVLKSLGAEFFVDDKPADMNEIKQYLPEKSSSADSQGVDKEIIVRTYKVDNLREVVMNGQKFIIQS